MISSSFQQGVCIRPACLPDILYIRQQQQADDLPAGNVNRHPPSARDRKGGWQQWGMTLSMGADYFLQRQPANEDEAALLQDMKAAVHRASNIINLMLDFSKPRPLQLADENLNVIIENSLNLMRHQLLQQRVNVVRQLQPDLPFAPLDRTRMEHVFLNLITNAAQAMADGGTLTIRTAFHEAAATAPGEPPQIKVNIEDTGPGIPAEQVSKVFEPFFTTKPPGQGTGLGLAIVRKILQIHGGTVTLGNRPVGGACATLTFNLKPKEQP